MPLTSDIRAYDEAWPDKFADEAARLRPVFGVALASLHHIGSTAVPGLSAKNEIDMLAVVSVTSPPDWTPLLQVFDYRRGGDLSAGHHFFKRDAGGTRTHKLHICLSGHPMAEQMLRFRDHLRVNAEDRAAYQALKLRLEARNITGIGEYLRDKDPFIRAVMRRIS